MAVRRDRGCADLGALALMPHTSRAPVYRRDRRLLHRLRRRGARPRRNLEPTLLDVDEKLAPAPSRTPVWKPTSSFLPSRVAPISTSMHSAASSIRACR